MSPYRHYIEFIACTPHSGNANVLVRFDVMMP